MHADLSEVPCPLLITDENGRILLANAELQTAVGGIPHSMDSLLTPASSILCQTHVWPMLLRDGRVNEIYLELKSGAGMRLPVMTNARVVFREGQSHVIWIFYVAQERSQYETALLESKRRAESLAAEELTIAHRQTETAEMASLAKSSFLAHMSHEIRTPLSAISGMAKLIQLEPLSRTQTDRMHKLEIAVLHLTSTINDILDLSKIEANQLVLEEIPLNIDDVVANVVQMLIHRAQEKGLDLRVNVGRMPPGLTGDSTRLTQALLNMVGNAIKFTKTGSVSISTSVLEDGVNDTLVKLEVTDTGIGIPADKISSLFQPFVQADVSATRNYGGTGLGLAITKRLVQAMNGEAGVESALGVGSTFWITARLHKSLMVKDFVQHDPAENSALTLKREYAGRRVLLAEDDEFNSEIGSILLQNVGLIVDFAENGKVASDKATREHYDLILMDIQMPYMDGLEATRNIRRSESGNSVPIVAMTANAFVEDKQESLSAGMNSFITKPVDPSRLYQVILHEFRRSGI